MTTTIAQNANVSTDTTATESLTTTVSAPIAPAGAVNRTGKCPRPFPWNLLWTVGAGCLVLGVVAILYLVLHGNGAAAEQQTRSQVHEEIPVSVVIPRYGKFERTTVQPGSVQAYKSAQIFSEVSGILKEQRVDIGDEVKEGDVLAVIAVPDVDLEVQRQKAGWLKARAKAELMEARVETVAAERKAKEAGVVKADASYKSSQSWTKFRKKQVDRWQGLSGGGSISQKVVDESREKWEAARESERAARAALPAAEAERDAAAALVKEAQKDVELARAEVEVAKAQWDKAKVMQDFATVRAPFSGVISNRFIDPGNPVRAFTEGASRPLVSMETTDVFRVVVQLPDRDVPYADKGDAAFVDIDAFPGKHFPAKISRIAKSEDPQTRLMRVEIDLKNDNGKIVHGMYGRVTIILDKSEHSLSVPSTCLRDKTADGKAAIFVVRKDKTGAERAILTPARWGMDNGIEVEIVEGLQRGDRVVNQPPLDLVNGSHVVVVPTREHQK